MNITTTELEKLLAESKRYHVARWSFGEIKLWLDNIRNHITGHFRCENCGCKIVRYPCDKCGWRPK
jgi:hypothetical protein